MPGSDLGLSKQNYPPCNRAFALRMMNPTSYSDDHISPLDKEIQPIYKKFVAKTAYSGTESPSVGAYKINHFQRGDSTDLLSIDEISLSPASSCASVNEMDLYAIDENMYGSDTALIRQRSSLDARSVKHRRSEAKDSSSSNEGDYGLVRSYSSAGGFDGGYFNRGTPNRSTLPSRSRSKSNVKESGNNLYRDEASNYLQSQRSTGSPKGTRSGGSSSLRRTQSLKGNRQTSSNGASPLARPKSSASSHVGSGLKIRVASTKSSQLRAQMIETKQQKQNGSGTPSKPFHLNGGGGTPLRKGRQTMNSHKTTHSLNSTEEYISESDSSVFSEMDAYNPRHNPRGNRQASVQVNAKKKQPRLSKDSPSKQSKPSVASPKLNAQRCQNLVGTPKQLSRSDTFSDKLSEVCQLISEKHPGDFQILETLIEMQTAYEERNDLVKETISGLREKNRMLEYKCANSPNIPGLVIPLMRATNAFQTQLQSIMDAYHQPGVDEMCQFPEVIFEEQEEEEDEGELETPRENPLDQITKEANLVANQIEKLGGLGDKQPLVNGFNTPPHAKQNSSVVVNKTFTNSSGSDKENVCNGKQHDLNSPLESYSIINEPAIPVTV